MHLFSENLGWCNAAAFNAAFRGETTRVWTSGNCSDPAGWPRRDYELVQARKSVVALPEGFYHIKRPLDTDGLPKQYHVCVYPSHPPLPGCCHILWLPERLGGRVFSHGLFANWEFYEDFGLYYDTPDGPAKWPGKVNSLSINGPTHREQDLRRIFYDSESAIAPTAQSPAV